MATPFMNIDLPSVGVTIGPTWAQLLNDAISGAIDPHDHTPGRGTLVPAAGLNINSDVAWNNKNLNTVRQTRLQDQLGNLSAVADRGGIYRNADDLFYLDGAGNNVRLTAGGSVAGAAGNITGLVAPAQATYSGVTKTFTWTQGANFPAKMDSGDITFRETILNGNGITFKAPAALSAGYIVTWPGALPAATHMMGMTAGGVISVGDDQTFASRPTFEGVNVGNTADTTAGNIRFDGTWFEGRRNGAWRRMEGWELIAYEKLASATTFALVSGLAAYDELMLVVSCPATTTANLGVRFNSDSGGNYKFLTMGAVPAGGGAWAQSEGTTTFLPLGTTGGGFGTPVRSTMFISNSLATAQKNATATMTFHTGTTPSLYLVGGMWTNTAAQITSLQVVTSLGGTYAIGSEFQLFGRNAS